MDVILLSRIVLYCFGFFLIGVGFLMFLNPEKCRIIISKAGSTYLINYLELGIRLWIGLAFLQSSLYSKYEFYFTIIGYFLIISALALMCVPIKKHNQFSKMAAEKLKPIYLRLFAPFSILFGVLIIDAINHNLDIVNF